MIMQNSKTHTPPPMATMAAQMMKITEMNPSEASVWVGTQEQLVLLSNLYPANISGKHMTPNPISNGTD